MGCGSSASAKYEQVAQKQNNQDVLQNSQAREQGDEVIRPVENVEVKVTLPDYWDTTEGVAVKPDPAQLPIIQDMIDMSWEDNFTRDRKIAGANGVVPTGACVTNVLRVENHKLFRNYCDYKANVRAKRRGECETFEVDTKKFSKHLEADVNEMYLFHGTNPAAAEAIANKDFDMGKNGAAGAMFGPGIYLAEHASKSDEYAKEGDGIFIRQCVLLLCRAVAGRVNTVQDAGDASASVRSGFYDSICGDRMAAVGTCREMIFYSADAVYCEYIIVYSRCFGDNSSVSKPLASSEDLFVSDVIAPSNESASPALVGQLSGGQEVNPFRRPLLDAKFYDIWGNYWGPYSGEPGHNGKGTDWGIPLNAGQGPPNMSWLQKLFPNAVIQIKDSDFMGSDPSAQSEPPAELVEKFKKDATSVTRVEFDNQMDKTIGNGHTMWRYFLSFHNESCMMGAISLRPRRAAARSISSLSSPVPIAQAPGGQDVNASRSLLDARSYDIHGQYWGPYSGEPGYNGKGTSWGIAVNAGQGPPNISWLPKLFPRAMIKIRDHDFIGLDRTARSEPPAELVEKFKKDAASVTRVGFDNQMGKQLAGGRTEWRYFMSFHSDTCLMGAISLYPREPP